ncbi:MCP four helix bundle domain-containing protein [Undibacterium sp. 14-3-2]|uniref:methyl-accepting chemotaxis protein n=1 Tax=Undibacterium sp. 14-3-2 TaxID=2800129 RepID=UPI0019040C74|nr:methyl-accepting chemotaxis protein [Undibacterium sp. 14-3-2]MBK1889573.1 MCP four helix bundle domain-containing protein [Undibacterium sp. 14-3-2]
MNMNMKVGTRLGIGFGIVVMLLIGMTLFGINRMSSLNDGTSLLVNDRYPKVVLANEILDGINFNALAMRNLLITEDPEKIKAALSEIKSNVTRVGEKIAQLDKTISTEKGKQVFNEVKEARSKYVVTQNEYLKLIGEGKKQEAGEYLLSSVVQAQTAYFSQVQNLIALIGTIMVKSGEDAEKNYQNSRNMLSGIAIIAILLACGFAYWTTRSITRPLNQAVQIARTIADGDLTSKIQVESTDETGQLLQALKDMNNSLARVVAQVRTGTDTIASASTQIAAGNLDLSSRTEEQASSLEETAASMEELTSTVKQNADNARQANQLAAEASDVAMKGGDVVSEVVSTMSSINNSSKKIVDIISVIDGIAFQTNILALNAAVEAARAGEQGRGFAVVASEVRNLAQRSAAAAKEITVLIGDSVDQVSAGTLLVNKAGTTMSEVVNSVRRVTDIMAEITAASHEQSTGIEQVNQAIAQMDEVTQQNAALVEEAAAAAASLEDQAANLSELVDVFRIDSTQIVANAASTAVSHTQKAATAVRRPMMQNPAKRLTNT